ncbi:hypothetical protein [Shewanella litoralis]|uniref:Uncharacterized protein n=1 Tax=Shewanella litoralis TaxID=2282700 RepID=A0ABQ2R340_9GAMM|nr:hypothetical protein [Shewanella litoralis]GGQ09093.1 hypothetical protein GCM10009411_07400 [Shewanella litoralis]
MQKIKSPLLLSVVAVSACLLTSVFVPAHAKAPLDNDRLNRESHSVGNQHDGRRHSQYHSRHRDPWRLGLGLGLSHAWGWSHGLGVHSGWGINSGWGPTFGVSWPYDVNSRYDYRRQNQTFYPYSSVSVAPTTRYRVIDEPVIVPTRVSTPQQLTTATQVNKGLRSLPENAKVIQRESGTVYEWQGVEYYFDWNTQTYELAKVDMP